jgi:hypothetical protein
MSYQNISYKSYCWSLGTTSFRTKQFNQMIELQLNLLKEFFDIPENHNELWQGNTTLQVSYYNFLKDKGFLSGNETRKDKFAREKTSGLCELGLIDNNRRLTEVGEKLLEISQSCDYESSNIFKIAKDSYIFTKQFLKLSNNQVDNNIVRPYLVLIYLLSKLEYLSNIEFTYLLPLCVNKETTLKIAEQIKLLRNNQIKLDDIIVDTVLSLPNYQLARNLLLNNQVTEELICKIGMNRKSRLYDKPYYHFYKVLFDVCICKKSFKMSDLYEKTDSLKLKTLWKGYLFSSTSRNLLRNKPNECKSNAEIYNVNNETEFKKIFFEKMHLFKIKANLLDYSDLNKRYFKTTDTVLFSENKIVLDIIPKYIFKNISDSLFEEAFSESELLQKNCEIEEISNALQFNISDVYNEIKNNLGLSVINEENIQKILLEERLQRFKSLINSKFDDDTLIELLNYFEIRDDKKIFEMVTDNATIPTIFEYILGIIWYKISNYRGNILKYMNLSLEADLLPKTHACGGEADIVYEYDETEFYPKHNMLIEATLMDESTQRRGEMEPVSRHLGNHILRTGENAYCTFISPYLDINVLTHFRSLKHMGYYDTQNHSNHIPSLKVVPIKTKELKTILQKGIKYNELYLILDRAFEKESQIPTWYESELVANL